LKDFTLMSEKKCRIRRGKLVEIPEEWVGKIPHKQTIRKRQSKQTKKIKRVMQALRKGRVPVQRRKQDSTSIKEGLDLYYDQN
jgi:hypothetical protein